MITYIVRMKTVPGRRDELIEGLRELIAEVEADEPGALVYSFHTIDGEPDTLMTFELFADEAALAAHRDGPAVAKATPKFADLVAETVAWRGTPAISTGLPS